MDKILAEISAGELIDKITILEIKKEKIKDKEKLVEVEKELKRSEGVITAPIFPNLANVLRKKIPSLKLR